MADKEAFFESLLRPKKKRATHQTMEDFQEMRAREKDAEERHKYDVLAKEYREIKQLSREVVSRKVAERKKISDSTAISMPEGEVYSQKSIPAEERVKPRRLSRSRMTHSRTSSLQSSFARDPISPRGGGGQSKEETPEQKKKTFELLLSEIQGLREEKE